MSRATEVSDEFANSSIATHKTQVRADTHNASTAISSWNKIPGRGLDTLTWLVCLNKEGAPVLLLNRLIWVLLRSVSHYLSAHDTSIRAYTMVIIIKTSYPRSNTYCVYKFWAITLWIITFAWWGYYYPGGSTLSAIGCWAIVKRLFVRGVYNSGLVLDFMPFGLMLLKTTWI